MSDYSKECLQITPDLDVELLLGLMQEKRLGGLVLEDLATVWQSWLDKLYAVKLKLGDKEYIAVWLDEEIEHMVDQKWKDAPSESFRLNCLAQSMCMSAVYQLIPEVEYAGCAPAPSLSDDSVNELAYNLASALRAEKIPYHNIGISGLARRFSVLTPYPFQGACEICSLHEQCPKANANPESFHSVVLPGYAGLDKL